MDARRFGMVVAGAVVALLFALAALDRETERDLAARSAVSVQDAASHVLLCALAGACDPLDPDTNLAASFLRYAAGSEVSGFPVPPSAEPAPDPATRARLNSVLECTPQRIAAVTQVPAVPGWSMSQPPPPDLVRRAEADDPDALYALAVGLASGWSDSAYTRSDEDMFGMLVRAADAGHAAAMAEVGASYAFGYFDQAVQPEHARLYLERAAQLGEPIATFSLAMLPPETGAAMETYAQRRLDLELTSAEACYSEAIQNVALRVYTGERGFERDEALAERLIGLILD